MSIEIFRASVVYPLPLIVPEAFAIIRFASGFQDNPINI
jgi:hypothetical protein